jgi:hypothetical protein
MDIKASAAALAMAVGLASGASAFAADVSCRDVQAGGVSRVCRWRVSGGQTVNVFYGEPSKTPPLTPARDEIVSPPPSYAEPAAFYDSGYVYPYPYLLVDTRLHDRGGPPNLVRQPRNFRPMPTPLAVRPTFRSGGGGGRH